VFGGGASLAAVQVGMLTALYERGIVADVLVGTSAGALNAAFVASRPQTVQTAAELGRVWRGLRREDVFPVSISALVGGLCGKRDHLVPNHALRQLLRRYIDFDDLGLAATPLHVLAFDVLEGCEVLLSDGPAIDAISAAASIPGVFPPVAIGERRLIDGGVVNNTPISHAVALGAGRIYVLPTCDRLRPPRAAPRGALDAAMYGLSLLIDGRLEADIAKYSADIELIVLPAPNPLQVQPGEFGHANHLIREAFRATRKLLAQGDAAAGRTVSLNPTNSRAGAGRRVEGGRRSGPNERSSPRRTQRSAVSEAAPR
jgi:NTE family protein